MHTLAREDDHSSIQLEAFKNDVNEKPLKAGGLQHILMNDGYIHPINIIDGLAYISMHPFTQHEWDTLPHVMWTSDVEWDPKIFDHSITDDEKWFDTVSEL